MIVATHHLQNVKNSDRPPASIANKTLELIDLIKPAQTTGHTTLLLEGNSRNWLYTTLLILKEHYTTLITKSKLDLSDCLTEDWQEMFAIASKWAKKNLGRRLKPNTLDQAHEMIADLRAGRPRSPTTPNPIPTPHQSPWTTPRGNRITTTAQVIRETDPQLAMTEENFPSLTTPPQRPQAIR